MESLTADTQTVPAVTQTVADGCGRLRTVADTDTTFGEHGLTPTPPKETGTPLRIREKHRLREKVENLLSQRKVHVLTCALFGGGQHHARVKFAMLPVSELE